MQGLKKSGFNVSSAYILYVLKSDMESSFPVDAERGRRGTEGFFFFESIRLSPEGSLRL